LREGISFLDTSTFVFSNPQVIRDVSPGPSSLDRKRCLIKVTVIEQPPVTPTCPPLAFPFGTSTNCAITGYMYTKKACPSFFYEKKGLKAQR
jgi:hypothetical protein